MVSMTVKRNHVKATFWTEKGGKFGTDGPISSIVAFAAWCTISWGEIAADDTPEGRAMMRFVGAMSAYRNRLDDERNAADG